MQYMFFFNIDTAMSLKFKPYLSLNYNSYYKTEALSICANSQEFHFVK